MLTHFINSLVYTIGMTVVYFFDKNKTKHWIQLVEKCIERHTDKQYATQIGNELAQII